MTTADIANVPKQQFGEAITDRKLDARDSFVTVEPSTCGGELIGS